VTFLLQLVGCAILGVTIGSMCEIVVTSFTQSKLDSNQKMEDNINKDDIMNWWNLNKPGKK